MATVTASEPTFEELRAALSSPDAPYEIVDGKIIEVSVISVYANIIADRLKDAIKATVRPARLGMTFIETMFVLDADKNLRRRPDVAFVSTERWPLDRPIPTEGEMEVVPDLVIEVVSPNDLSGDLAKKTHEYFRYNVRQVWIVQPETREIVIYRSPKLIEAFVEDDELTAPDLLPGLRVPLTALFSTAMD